MCVDFVRISVFCAGLSVVTMNSDKGGTSGNAGEDGMTRDVKQCKFGQSVN